jgi:hypothetical protein
MALQEEIQVTLLQMVPQVGRLQLMTQAEVQAMVAQEVQEAPTRTPPQTVVTLATQEMADLELEVMQEAVLEAVTI